MRLQDELMLLFPSQGWQNRKFLLWQLEEFGAAFDCEEVLGFVRAAVRDEHATVRHQALWSRQWLEPTVYRRRYGSRAFDGSLWTQQSSGRSPAPDPRMDQSGVAERDQSSATRVIEWLAPVLDELALHAPQAAAPIRDLMLSAAAEFPTTSSLALLEWETRRSGDAFASLLAVARVRSHLGDSMDGSLSLGYDVEPDHFLLAGFLSDENLARDWHQHASRLPDLARMNLAIAMGGRATSAAHPVAMGLVALANPWVDAYILRAVARWPVEDALAAIEIIARRARSSFVQSLSLRAAAATRSVGAIALVSQFLSSEDPRVQAQAMESLVVLGADTGELRRSATQGLTSANLRLKVNSMLVLAVTEGRIPDAVLHGLVVDHSALARLEAAYCLGFLSDERSWRFLELLALGDPVPAVASQAVSSLAKLPPSFASRTLLEVIETREDEAGSRAVRALGRNNHTTGRDLAELLADRLGKPLSEQAEARLVRAVGDLGSVDSDGHVGALLLRRLGSVHPPVQKAALRSWIARLCLFEGDATTELRRLVDGPDSQVASLAALALVLQGRELGVTTLRRLVSSPVELEQIHGLEVLTELGLLISQVLVSGGMPSLRKALDLGSARTPMTKTMASNTPWGAALEQAVQALPPPLDGPMEPPLGVSDAGSGEQGSGAFEDAVKNLENVQRKTRTLRPLPATDQEVSERLRVQTYRVDDIPPEWTEGLGRIARVLKSFLSANPMPGALLSGIVVFAITSAILHVAAPERPSPDPTEPALAVSVMRVVGSITTIPPGSVAPGRGAAVGTQFDLATGASCVLTSLRGIRLRAWGPLHLALLDVGSDATSLDVLVEGVGGLEVDVPGGCTANLAGVKDRVEIRGGALRVSRADDLSVRSLVATRARVFHIPPGSAPPRELPVAPRGEKSRGTLPPRK